MLIDGKEIIIQIEDKEYHCALDITMDYIGGKWKTIVLWYLRNGTKRFSELKRQIPGITEKMLTLQLRDLEEDGIITRTIYPEIPPKVEYQMTDFGKTLIPMLNEMAKWGRMMSETRGKLIEKG